MQEIKGQVYKDLKNKKHKIKIEKNKNQSHYAYRK